MASLQSLIAYEFENIGSFDSDLTQNGIRPIGIYIGVDSDLVLTKYDGTSETFKGAKAGSIIPVEFREVDSSTTGATAGTDLVALFPQG